MITAKELHELADDMGSRHPDEAAKACRDAANTIEQLQLGMEGADEAFGHIVEEKQRLEKECQRLKELLDSAYAQIKNMAKQSN